MTALGFGLAANAPLETVLAAARAAEAAGFSSFWINNPPGMDGFTPLGKAREATSGVRLATGVVPVSYQTPSEMVAAAGAAGLGRDRFLLGIGSGSGAHPVDRVRGALAELRATSRYELAIAALGPRMCALAGEAADAVVLSWLVPDYARRSVERVREAASQARRRPPRTYLYMRAAIGADAVARLEKEAARYAEIPSYAANLARQGRPVLETTVRAGSAAEVPGLLAPWSGAVDEIVLRAITAQDRPEEAVELVEAARPFLAG
jgi:alkanesulfonate monooxygenase SsuD/methylene tetrahydromethanopterin reductase-like flavin-dependent oxidoreductase (luciferase family)